MSKSISILDKDYHRYIIDKCSNNPDKALFYVHQTLEYGWSRAMKYRSFKHD